MEPSLHIEPLSAGQQIPFDLLKLADPSKEQIDAYLKSGTCYIAKLESETVGVLVLAKVNADNAEIKNIAVKESEQGQGFGKLLLRFAQEVSRETGYKNLIIGTGNSSIGQLALYQKEGFEITKIVKDFFLKHYNEPIFENGIQCKHKVILKKELGA